MTSPLNRPLHKVGRYAKVKDTHKTISDFSVSRLGPRNNCALIPFLNTPMTIYNDYNSKKHSYREIINQNTKLIRTRSLLVYCHFNSLLFYTRRLTFRHFSILWAVLSKLIIKILTGVEDFSVNNPYRLRVTRGNCHKQQNVDRKISMGETRTQLVF